MTGQGGPRGSG